MGLPIPGNAKITVDVDSRCFCCFRLPKSSPHKSGSDKLEPRITKVFSESKEEKKDNEARSLSQQHVVSLFEK